MSNIKVCRWLDSNCWPLASEVTTLPTEPQPLPTINYYSIKTRLGSANGLTKLVIGFHLPNGQSDLVIVLHETVSILLAFHTHKYNSLLSTWAGLSLHFPLAGALPDITKHSLFPPESENSIRSIAFLFPFNGGRRYKINWFSHL